MRIARHINRLHLLDEMSRGTRGKSIKNELVYVQNNFKCISNSIQVHFKFVSNENQIIIFKRYEIKSDDKLEIEDVPSEENLNERTSEINEEEECLDKDNLKLLGYEPIIIEGKAYSLGDLHGSTGWNIMEKGM